MLGTITFPTLQRLANVYECECGDWPTKENLHVRIFTIIDSVVQPTPIDLCVTYEEDDDAYRVCEEWDTDARPGRAAVEALVAVNGLRSNSKYAIWATCGPRISCLYEEAL